MILATGIALRAGGVVGGVGIGLLAVAIAQQVPLRMERENRPRPVLWWAAAVAIAAWFGWQAALTVDGWALLPAYLAFGATTLAVTLTDLDHRLIPNRVLFPGLGAAGVLMAVGALVDGSGPDLVRAVAAGGGYFLFLFLIALLARDGFGMGDVKLAMLLGLFLGYTGWDAVGVGFVLAIMLGGIASVIILIFMRKGMKAKFAYGPYLVAGAWIGLFWGPQIADWYLGNGG